MTVSPFAQDLVQKFNDDEAVWRASDARKRLREILGTKYPLTAEIADMLDWQRAERCARPLRAIGRALP